MERLRLCCMTGAFCVDNRVSRDGPWLANRGPGTNLDGLERRGGLPAAGELEHGGFVEGRGRV